MSFQSSKKEAAAFARKYIAPASVYAQNYGVLRISDGYKIYVNPDIKTAATFYDESQKKHCIMIGNDMSRHIGTDTHHSVSLLVRALLIHELGHTLFTHVDMKSLNLKLKKHSIPFSLLNLAEDARIENLIKQEIKNHQNIRYFFNWEKWFVSPEIQANSYPESILFYLINTEGRESGSGIYSFRVREYYDRFLLAKDTFEVVDILVEWKKEFRLDKSKTPEDEINSRIDELKDAIQEAFTNSTDSKPSNDSTPLPSQSSSGEPSNEADPQLRSFGDIGNPVDSSGNPIPIEEAIENSVEISDSGKFLSPDNAFKVDTSFNTVTVSEASNSSEIFTSNSKEGAYNDKEARDIEKSLHRLSSDKKRKKGTNKPTGRFNTSRLYGVLSDPSSMPIYQSNTKKRVIAKNILFVIDLSGSMSGTPIESTRTLLLGANSLSKKSKAFNVSVLGSKVIGSKSIYQTISLPANDKDLLSIESNGSSEGIGYALENSTNIVKKNDVVVFITDGNIHDQEISKKSIGKYLKNNATTVGIYVEKNNNIHNTQMSEWFDHLIVKSSMVDVIDELVSLVNSPHLGQKIKSMKNDCGLEESSSPKM